jgi:hypothetical protein
MRHVITGVEAPTREGCDVRLACGIEVFVPAARRADGLRLDAEPGHFVDLQDAPGVQPGWCNVCRRHASGRQEEQGLHGDLGMLEEDSDVIEEVDEERADVIKEEQELPDPEWEEPKG